MATGMLAVAACLAMCGGACAAAVDLQAGMAQALQDQQLTGAVWATVTPERGVQVGAAGLKDASRGMTMAPGDRVHVGSIVKTAIATSDSKWSWRSTP